MYHFFSQLAIRDFSPKNIDEVYDQGFVFTRLGKGVVYQVRSLRVCVSEFELSSENRRVLRKGEDVLCRVESLPYLQYTWSVGKLGHEFYERKFGQNIMSANKLKEMFTDPSRSNVNCVFVYSIPGHEAPIGYCLGVETPHIIHYSYPFYDLSLERDLGMVMMVKAITWAQERTKQYIYLGTLQKYKLQFKGVEWWDGKKWINNEGDRKPETEFQNDNSQHNSLLE